MSKFCNLNSIESVISREATPSIIICSPASTTRKSSTTIRPWLMSMPRENIFHVLSRVDTCEGVMPTCTMRAPVSPSRAKSACMPIMPDTRSAASRNPAVSLTLLASAPPVTERLGMCSAPIYRSSALRYMASESLRLLALSLRFVASIMSRSM